MLRRLAQPAVTLAALGTLIWSQLQRMPTYVTMLGEQRSIVLADGSTIHLNSRSSVKVHYTERERAVRLLGGQALFHVARDASRPFVVHSGETLVRAVGTQFDVYRKHGGTIVSVVEGRVAIITASGERTEVGATSSGTPQLRASVASEGRVLLSAGEQLTVTPETLQKTDRPNISSATAWTQRQLVFESASLAEAAEEFNRYNERRLVIEGDAPRDFHISGVFSSTDPASFVAFLRSRPGLRVTESASDIRVTKN